MKAEVYPSPDGWRFRVKGDNGEIMAVGEAYVRRIDAESALRALFNSGSPIEVTVRDHHTNVTDHYTLGRLTDGRVYEIYEESDQTTQDEPALEDEPEV